MQIKNVLAIETSCDDTSVAIVAEDGQVLACFSANQDLAHAPFGGVVPEIAGRNHSENLLPLVDKVITDTGLKWKDISALAVTARPGLVGSLLVGLVTAKTLAVAHQLPFIGINHIEGHIWAPFLRDQSYFPPPITFPFLSLAVSGGHTQLTLVKGVGEYHILGHTIDDAAGEAFDKFAKMLGLGYPGGVRVDEMAKSGDIRAFQFPRPLLKEDHFLFSFSGLKTAALQQLSQLSESQRRVQCHDLCASYQEAIVEVLVSKLKKACTQTQVNFVSITGGVSANSRLRQVAFDWAKKEHVSLAIPPLRYCTDNAAMIGLAALQRLKLGEFSSHDLSPSPRSLPTDFINEIL